MHRKLITVKYPDGQINDIPTVLLNTMIETKKIVGFKRKDGWVIIGKDSIRGMGHGHYHGREKRYYWKKWVLQ